MIRVKQFEFSLFGVNTYLVIDVATKQAAVVDPAMNDDAERRKFDAYVECEGLTITQVINTHLHLDHCFGTDYVHTKYGVPVKAHPADAFLGENLDKQYSMFGMKPTGRGVTIDVDLKAGDIIDIGESQLQVIHVPGHTPGGIALYSKEGNILLAGDSLFNGSIGRTDLFGDYDQLISSLKKQLLTLPPGTLVLPGHGPSTTIGRERDTNPYLS